MKDQLRALILELKQENENRSAVLSNPDTSDHSYSITVHAYNNTLNFIKRLEKLILSV